MSISFKERPYAITDIETTGLFLPEAEIIEIGLVLVNQTTLEVVAEFEQKILPEHPETASSEALEWNTYNTEEWNKEAVSLTHATKLYSRLTKGAMLCAWNLPFEYRFLEDAFNRTGAENQMDYHYRDLPSMAAEILRYTDIEGEKLEDTCEFLGIEPEPFPHRALEGARVEYLVYKSLRIIEEARLKGSGMDEFMDALKKYNNRIRPFI